MSSTWKYSLVVSILAVCVGYTPAHTSEPAPPPALVLTSDNASYRLLAPNSVCSCTLLLSTGSVQVWLTAGHCVHGKRGSSDPNAVDETTKYRIQTLDRSKSYAASAIWRSDRIDIGFLVSSADIAPARTRLTATTIGRNVTHRGVSSGRAAGTVTRYHTPESGGDSRTSLVGTWNSIPGDSGAGIWDGDKLCGVNWGGDGRSGYATSVLYLRVGREAIAGRVLAQSPKDDSITSWRIASNALSDMLATVDSGQRTPTIPIVNPPQPPRWNPPPPRRPFLWWLRPRYWG